MIREEFEEALDAFEDRGYWTGEELDGPSWLDCNFRDFLWELMTEGLSAVDKLPPKPKAWEPIDYRHRPMSPPSISSRYETMNREVQIVRSKASPGLLRFYRVVLKHGELPGDELSQPDYQYGNTLGYSFFSQAAAMRVGDLPLIAYAKHQGNDYGCYHLMSVNGETIHVAAEEFDRIWPVNLTESEERA